MTDNKLYIVLTHFDKIAQNRLRKYVRSPYFNVNETLMVYFDILTNHINKNGKGTPLEKEDIWAQLFPKEAYNDVRFRKLCSDLLKLVEGFLSQEVYDDNNLQKASNLLEALTNKKIEKLFSSSVRSAQLASEQPFQKSAGFYYYQYLLEKNYYELGDVDLKREEKSNVENIINSLDEFYLAEKLKWYNNVLSRKNLISHEYHLLFIDEIIKHIEKHEYKHNPVICIFYNLLLTKIDAKNENHLDTFIELLHEHGQLFSMKELYELYSGALNYCIQKGNQGKPDFLKKFHDLYSFMLDKGIAYGASNNSELSPWHFKNAVLVALRIGQYDWTEKFITNNRDKLPVEFRENAYSYNLALLYFYQKKYDKATQLLQSVEYDDLAYSLDSKCMLLAMYYEQDEDEALMSLMDSFKTYLNRHKDIAENKRINYFNLMKYTRKMLKLNHGDKNEIIKIRQEIDEDRKAAGIASLKWLLEKLAELE
jgi:hypothetical protein